MFQAILFIILGPCSTTTLSKFADICQVGGLSQVLQQHGLSVFSRGMFGPDMLFQPALSFTDRIHLYSFGGLGRTLNWIREYRQAECVENE